MLPVQERAGHLEAAPQVNLDRVNVAIFPADSLRERNLEYKAHITSQIEINVFLSLAQISQHLCIKDFFLPVWTMYITIRFTRTKQDTKYDIFFISENLLSHRAATLPSPPFPRGCPPIDSADEENRCNRSIIRRKGLRCRRRCRCKGRGRIQVTDINNNT